MTVLNVSPLESLKIWGELMECLYDDNSYGGTVAEIYMYRLMPHSPHVSHNPQSKWAKEDYARANQALYDLCKLFEEHNEVTLEFEGGHPLDLLVKTPEDPFTHRVHLKIADHNVRRWRRREPEFDLSELRRLKAATKPQPEQDSRVGEAMAGRIDTENMNRYVNACVAFVNRFLLKD